jgi:CBS domain-containing protein
MSSLEGFAPETPARDVAKLFEDRDLVSAPVVSRDGKLLGRITIDDVVDVIREEADHLGLSMAGLTEDEDLFAGVRTTARRRAIWLSINLATAIFAANVVGLFEATIEKVVALAVLMPIVASMGGIAGSQTLVLIIRGMALGQVEMANARWLLAREIAVGLLNGIMRGGGPVVSRLDDRPDHFRGAAHQFVRGGARRRGRAAGSAAAGNRSGTRRRRGAHDRHGYGRLRVAIGPRHVVPDVGESDASSASHPSCRR